MTPTWTVDTIRQAVDNMIAAGDSEILVVSVARRLGAWTPERGMAAGARKAIVQVLGDHPRLHRTWTVTR